MDPSKQIELNQLEAKTGEGKITVIGVSHISPESLDKIQERLEQDYDIIALELDPIRLKGLLQQERNSGKGPLWFRLVGRIQRHLGSKTGVMPGDEQIYAYRQAKEQDKEVVLIDQDIRITIQKLKQVSILEKIKAIGLGILSIFSLYRFQLDEIPDEEEVRKILQSFEKHLPEFYKTLVHDRNAYMAEALQNVHQDNPEDDILAVVGAAHKPGIEKILEEKNIKND